MPAHSGASTPSRGWREGIGTGVSRRPEANRRIASFLYYSYRRKGNSTIKPSTATCGTILSLFQAGKRRDGNAASPPLIVGDSRYSAAEPKARRPPTPNTLKSVKRARNLSVSGKKSAPRVLLRVSTYYYQYPPTIHGGAVKRKTKMGDGQRDPKGH
jgi:hypothetical protein